MRFFGGTKTQLRNIIFIGWGVHWLADLFGLTCHALTNCKFNYLNRETEIKLSVICSDIQIQFLVHESWYTADVTCSEVTFVCQRRLWKEVKLRIPMKFCWLRLGRKVLLKLICQKLLEQVGTRTRKTKHQKEEKNMNNYTLIYTSKPS